MAQPVVVSLVCSTLVFIHFGFEFLPRTLFKASHFADFFLRNLFVAELKNFCYKKIQWTFLCRWYIKSDYLWSWLNFENPEQTENLKWKDLTVKLIILLAQATHTAVIVNNNCFVKQILAVREIEYFYIILWWGGGEGVGREINWTV